jgi:energy-coupling factor transport system ATP-binding protein
VRANRLAFRFPGHVRWVWSDVNFELRRGERVALVGANGSGKSTLLAVLAGLLHPTQGSLSMEHGVSGAACSSDAGRPVCGLVLQNPDLMLFCGSVRDELAFGPRHSGVAEHDVACRVYCWAGLLGISELLDEPPLALSQGQRLRTALAAALTADPSLLLLDEPTTGQDQHQVTSLMNALCHSPNTKHQTPNTQLADRTLLFSTHDLRTVARYADRVLVLADGRLLADSHPHELLSRDDWLAAAGLRRPPLFEVRSRLGLLGISVNELAAELAT